MMPLPLSVRALGVAVAMLSVCAATAAPIAPVSTKASATPTLADVRLSFEQNRGQFDARVRYAAHAANAMIFLTDTAVTYVVPMADDKDRHYALRMRWLGANAAATVSSAERRPHQTNYLIGNDASRWQHNVPSFGEVRYAEVYPGVAMVWRGHEQGASEYAFELAAGADATQIGLAFDGADRLETDADGNLLIHTAAGVIRQTHPVAYQQTDAGRRPVPSAFVVDGHQVRFWLGTYDQSLPLVIDPTVELNRLAFSTYLGGVGNDVGQDIAVDRIGDVYVTGQTLSPAFPTTVGALDPSYSANAEAFVTKLSGSGASLVYSTFIGGTGADQGMSIAVDDSGNAYVTGSTTSAGFPVTVGAFDTTFNGSSDAYALKLSATGATLIYSTYIGGGVFDEAFAIAIDTGRNAVIVGRTAGGTFPTTATAFDTSFNGTNDVFVSKFDSTGATLSYSTFLGGSESDFGEGVALDAAGLIYITGFTAKSAAAVSDFPTTAGAFSTIHGGGNDIFVSKLNAGLAGAASLVYSTFIGGTDSDSARSIVVDATGQATIIGSVLNGGGYPVTVGAYDTTHNGALDVVVTALNPAGSALIYSTYIGGNGSDIGNGVALDHFGNTYITGYSINSGTDFPTTANAYQLTHNGGHDVYMAKLSGNGTTLLYSTLIGGLGDDDGNALAVDTTGNVYCTGLTNASTTPFPTTLIGYQVTYGGGQDVFVSKFGSYAINGRAVDAATGDPVAGVMVALSGITSESMLTGPDGRFGFTNTLDFAPYSVAASRTNYNINPNIFTFTLDASRELVFLAAPGLPSMIADLAISKSDGVSTVVAGSTLTYTTLASNLGGNSAIGGSVVDTFPPELNCNWTCVGLAGGLCSAAGSGSINDSVTLPAGASVIYTAHCAISPSATGTLISSATVAPPSGVSDPLLTNNTVTDTDTILPDALLRDGFE